MMHDILFDNFIANCVYQGTLIKRKTELLI